MGGYRRSRIAFNIVRRISNARNFYSAMRFTSVGRAALQNMGPSGFIWSVFFGIPKMKNGTRLCYLLWKHSGFYSPKLHLHYQTRCSKGLRLYWDLPGISNVRRNFKTWVFLFTPSSRKVTTTAPESNLLPRAPQHKFETLWSVAVFCNKSGSVRLLKIAHGRHRRLNVFWDGDVRI